MLRGRERVEGSMAKKNPKITKKCKGQKCGPWWQLWCRVQLEPRFSSLWKRWYPSRAVGAAPAQKPGAPPIHLGGSRNPSLSQKSLAQRTQGTWAGVKDSK